MFSKNYRHDPKFIIYLSGKCVGMTSVNLSCLTQVHRVIISFFFLRYSRNQDFLSTEDLTLFLEAEQGVKINDQ